MKLKDLELEIEILRKKMHNILEKGVELMSEEAVDVSQELDRLLTQYDKLKIDLKNKGR